MWATAPARAALASVWFLVAATASIAGGLEGKVVSVTDGDTIKVLDASKVQHVVRLSGIDAPEKKMPFGQRSKQNLSTLVYGKWVQIEGSKNDRYGRSVGKVLVNNRDANLAQIQAGMAWHYKQYQREQSILDRQLYADAQVTAAHTKQGLWQEPDPIPPWDWRKDRRQK